MWFQAYIPPCREVIESLLKRVEAAGFDVLVVTVDVPIASMREIESRNGFSVPLRPNGQQVRGGLARPRWMVETFAQPLLKHGIPHFESFTATRSGPIITSAKGTIVPAGIFALLVVAQVFMSG